MHSAEDNSVFCNSIWVKRLYIISGSFVHILWWLIACVIKIMAHQVDVCRYGKVAYCSFDLD